MGRLSVLVAGFLLAAGCSGIEGEGRTIVASIYPLAFAAEGIAGPDWEVIDLTPPGVEAHDLELTLEQRSAIQDADMVVYLGEIGFQPQVERAVRESEGTVVDLSVALDQRREPLDPHAWLEPFSFSLLVKEIGEALCSLEDPCSQEEAALRESLDGELFQLHESYTQDLIGCRYRTMIVSHEAFGYLEIHRLRQFGLAGLTPEAEPSADRLAEAGHLIDGGEAGALFYEARGEDPDADKGLAEDLGVPALPLDTLESAPPEGDYLTVMSDNLDSLREGLQCR
ncbi:MAG: metal ABC transporter substrate-binding protein [Actinomycetota bacterium]